MSQILRTWLAFAAVAAGLIHLALVIGSPAAVGAVFATVGLAEFAWGLLTMATSRLLAPRIALAGALVPVALWAVGLLLAGALRSGELSGALRFFPLAIATLFELGIAAAIAVHLRRLGNGGGVTSAAAVGTGRYLAAVIGGALVVTSLTAPALAATEAAKFSSPAGTFSDEHGH